MILDKENITTSISDKKIISVPMNMISSRDINPRKGGLIAENIDALIEAKGEFPEIFLGLYENELIIIDGWHRYTANQRNNIDTINAFIVEFKSLSEMKLQAFKENLNHGIRLSDIDVAINLYDFYLDSIKTDSLLNIKKLVTNLGLKERRGRLLFEFAVIHKEILEEIPNEITNISFYEDYFSLLKKNNEIIGSISEEFKLKFKSFYNRYKNLPKSELRLAISDFAEGKDYYEEKEKQQKIIEEMEKQDLEAKKDSIEVISSDDLIDRNANANLNYENPIIKEIVERKEEENNYDSEINNIDNQNDLYEEKKVNDKNKYVSLDKSVKEIKDILSNIKLLCIKNKAIITKENKNDINEIMDNLDELMRDYSME